MAKFIKHVGKIVSTGRKCVVVFREIPNEPSSCLVVETESLPTIMHDDLQKAVENAAAQSDMDFFKYTQRTTFNDGRNMLAALHESKLLNKYPTSDIMMMPNVNTSILLSELNTQLGAINGAKTTSTDIGKTQEPQPLNAGKTPGVLDDVDIANQMRAQAAYFNKESARLLKEAEALSPLQKSNSTTEVGETNKVTTIDESNVATQKTKRSYNKKIQEIGIYMVEIKTITFAYHFTIFLNQQLFHLFK